MTLGEWVAILGAAELLVLLVVLAAMLTVDDHPVSLDVEPPREEQRPREAPEKVDDAA